MSTGWVIVIIVVSLAIILSNIMLLKKTANQKMPSLKDLEQKSANQQTEANVNTEKTTRSEEEKGQH